MGEVLRLMRLFNEKADHLEGLSFTQKIMTEQSGFRMEFHSDEGGRAWRHGPGGESVDAFVLTFRYFVQDQEVSFRRMARTYAALGAAGMVSSRLADEFNELRDQINAFLDQESYVKYNKEQLTQRRIFEVFMWGGLAHANEAKKALLDEWRQVPFFYLMLENEFVRTLAILLGAIFRMRGMNQEALRELQA
jgi:hypothetical protein